jgi:hypothetical protein
MSMEKPSSASFRTGAWRAALACGPNGGNCVEVNLSVPGSVGVRDNKPSVRPALVFTSANWQAFLTATRADSIH